MRAILSRNLSIFTPFFTSVDNQKRLMLQTIYVLKKISYNQEEFQIKSGF